MTNINHLIFLLNKINFDKFINSNYDEKTEYIQRVLNDKVGDDPIYKVKTLLYALDEFVYYFNKTNNKVEGCWC